MSYRSKVDLIKAREIIAGFLLWHDPAYKPGPSESIEALVAEAKSFMWPNIWPQDQRPIEERVKRAMGRPLSNKRQPDN